LTAIPLNRSNYKQTLASTNINKHQHSSELMLFQKSLEGTEKSHKTLYMVQYLEQSDLSKMN